MAGNGTNGDRLERAAGYLVGVREMLQLGPPGRLFSAVELLQIAVDELIGELRELRESTLQARKTAGGGQDSAVGRPQCPSCRTGLVDLAPLCTTHWKCRQCGHVFKRTAPAAGG